MMLPGFRGWREISYWHLHDDIRVVKEMKGNLDFIPEMQILLEPQEHDLPQAWSKTDLGGGGQ